MADMKLVDGGAHSVGVNNDNDRQYVSATPKGTLTSVVEFTNVGGVLGQPTVQNAASGLISAGTELWFKNSGSSTLVKTVVGGVSTSGSGPYTYTLSSLTPALTGAIGDWTAAYKVRSDKSKPIMYLATGQTDEPLCKETALTLTGSTSTTQVVATGPSSLLPYFATGNLSKNIVITVGGTEYTVTPNGTVSESSSATNPTFDPANKASGCTLSNGNLTMASSSEYSGVLGTIGIPSSSKVYFEFQPTVANPNNAKGGYFGVATSAWAKNYEGTGFICIRGDSATNLAVGDQNTNIFSVSGSITTSDIIQVAIDLANRKLWFGKNNSWYKADGSTGASPSAGTDPTVASMSLTSGIFPAASRYTDGGCTINFGASSFAYTPPTGFVGLGSSTYTTTIPIATQASTPTAAKIADRFTTAVDIDTVTYVTGPELDVAGETTTLTDDPTLKRLALKVRGDTAVGVRSKDWVIETTEKAG